MSVLLYRPEIDGLRGIAVLAVILFHAELLGFRSGYLGVDIFFVISGYLIATIILLQLRSGKFSILDFYERRARRILPALLAMVAVVLPIAYVYLLPKDLVAFGWSVISVATFTSNFLFSGRVGYFDLAAHLEPLLHTWSLAVEEQFYLFFPLLVALIWRWRQQRLAVVLGVLAASSLALAMAQVSKRPDFVFFQIIPRAWELLAGVLTALYVARSDGQPLGPKTREVGSAIGLMLVVASFLVFDESPLPGVLNNVVPVFGTCLLLACSNRETGAGRVLASRGLVFVGLISYSAYLWHQPLFAFVRYIGPSDISSILSPVLVLMSLGIGYLSYRFVEQPFRRKGYLSRRQIFAGSLGGLVLVAAFAGLAVSSAGFPGRLPQGIEWRSLGEKLEAVGDVCSARPVPGYPGVEACAFGRTEGKRIIALYGDSHAQAVQYELDRRLKERGDTGMWVKVNGCHVVPDIVENGDVSQLSVCRAAFQELQRYIRDKVDAVLVVSRWTMRFYPIEGRIDNLSFDNGEGGVEYNRFREYAAVDTTGRIDLGEKAKRAALGNLLRKLDETGKPIVLIYPVPELGWDIAKMNFYAGRMLEEISTSRQIYRQRNAFVIDFFDGYEGKNLIKIPVAELFCDAVRCFGQRGGVPLYYDDDHLSTAGSRLIVDKAFQALP